MIQTETYQEKLERLNKLIDGYSKYLKDKDLTFEEKSRLNVEISKTNKKIERIKNMKVEDFLNTTHDYSIDFQSKMNSTIFSKTTITIRTTYTRSNFERFLNENSPELDDEKWIIRGKRRHYKDTPKYGRTLRFYDPRKFESFFQDWKRLMIIKDNNKT